MQPQALDIGHQIGCRIVDQAAERGRAPGASLVEDDDAIGSRIKEAAMQRLGAGTWSTVEEECSGAPGVAALLPIHGVDAVQRQQAALISFDLGEKLALHHVLLDAAPAKAKGNDLNLVTHGRSGRIRRAYQQAISRRQYRDEGRIL